MKLTGVIIDYDGYNGIIETETKERYILVKEEIVSHAQLQKLDSVSFVPEKVETTENEYNMARFVRKLSKNTQIDGYSHFHPIE